MPTEAQLERLLAYDRWANGNALGSVEALATPPAKAVELLAHVLGAQLSWLESQTAAASDSLANSAAAPRRRAERPLPSGLSRPSPAR